MENKRWSGLWSEPQDDNSMYGVKLIEGDTIYLMAVDTNVREETMRKWLTGERTITVHGLVRVARVLGVPMETLTKGLF